MNYSPQAAHDPAQQFTAMEVCPWGHFNVWRYIDITTEEERLGLALGGRGQGCCETS